MISRILYKLPLITNKTKITISALLLALATLCSIAAPERLDRTVCAFAMFFSFIGDVLLNCTPHDKRPHWLLYSGAAFFMVSHLLYAAAYMFLISAGNFNFATPGAYIAYAIMAVIFIASVTFIILTTGKNKIVMLLVFMVYLSMISMNFITICSYSWSLKSISFIGSASFLISDCIIGIETVFKIKNDTLRKLVWIFYPIGQFIIIVCR